MWNKYAAAARELTVSLTEGTYLSPVALQVVQAHLDRQLSRRFPSLSPPDREDLISDAIRSLLSVAREGRVDIEGNPGGYIWQTTQNRALDWFRKDQPEPAEHLPEPGESDERIARLLDADASAQEVRDAMRELISAGEIRTSRLIGEWLVEAQRLGRAPSTREAGAALGTSHDSVARALKLFGEALVDARARSGAE